MLNSEIIKLLRTTNKKNFRRYKNLKGNSSVHGTKNVISGHVYQGRKRNATYRQISLGPDKWELYILSDTYGIIMTEKCIDVRKIKPNPYSIFPDEVSMFKGEYSTEVYFNLSMIIDDLPTVGECNAIRKFMENKNNRFKKISVYTCSPWF